MLSTHSAALIVHIHRRVDVERATDSSPDGGQQGSSTREAMKTISQMSIASSPPPPEPPPPPPPPFALESTVLRKRAVGKRVAGRYVDLGQFSDDE